MELLWLLGACLFFTASALTAALKLPTRGDRILSVALLANVGAVAPVYALGLASRLTRMSLLWAVVMIAAVTLAAMYPLGPAILGVSRDVLLAVPRTFRAATKENAPVALVGAMLVGYVLWSHEAAYWAPTWRSFDSLWYHEPIVGFTIQNRGFAWVDVPHELDVVNANPRASEMLQTFFALFGGRRLVELPASITFAGAGVAHYALFGRVTQRADLRLGFSTAVLLVPAFFIQIGSTYIDVHVWGLVVTGLYFATAPKVRPAELFLTALALALATGGKATTYVPSAIVFVLAAGRHVERRKLLGSLGRVGLAGGVAGLLVAFTMARNWAHFRNPFFPVPITSSALGIAWPGLGNPFEDAEVAEPFLDTWRRAATGPFGDGRYNYPYFVLPHTAREAASAYNYGYVTAYLFVPFGFAALLYLGFRTVAIPMLGLRRDHRPRLGIALTLALMGACHTATLHYLHLARYQGVLFTLLATAIVCAGELLEAPKWSASLAGAACALGVATLAIQEPRVYLVPSDLEDMKLVPYPERETTPKFGAPTTREGGLYRAQRFLPGTTVAFVDNVQSIGPLWNDKYSNRVVYFHDDPRLLAELDAAGVGNFICPTYCTKHPEVIGRWTPAASPYFSFALSSVLYERRR